MGLDTVSLSTKKNMYTVYRDWRYSDSKLDFKSYMLEKDERIEAFANSFKQYNSGDMFTKETVVELEDGRLLCFDSDEFTKAYLIDLSDITKNDINFDMETDFKMIKADKSKAGYETRNDAILSYLGDDIKTKDGITLNEYLVQKETSDNSTDVDSVSATNQFYYKNISQMSSDKEEQEYYQYIIESLGGSVDNDGKITIGQESSLSKLNDKIKRFEKYMSKTDNQSKFNTLVLLQQLGLSELELIEKLTPGFLEQVKAYIGEYESVSHTDDNGFQSATSQVINFEKIMTYKYNNSDEYWMYLSLEDRKTVFDKGLQNEPDGSKISQAADALTQLSSATSASIESTMYANLEQRVSETTIQAYVEEFNDIFNTTQDGLKEDHTYDEALEYLAMLCTENVSGEILYYFLQNIDVQKCLATLGIQKGTLPTGKTADKTAEEQLTVQKVFEAMAQKINSYIEEACTIMGDKERIESQKALDATISFLDMASGGINVKYNENQGWCFVGGLGLEAVVQAGLFVWANRAANDIVEKSTTKALKNAAENALANANKAVKEAVKDATEAANKAANAAREAAEELNQIEDKIETVLKNFDVADDKKILDSLKFDTQEDILKSKKDVKNSLTEKLNNLLKKLDPSDTKTWNNYVREIHKYFPKAGANLRQMNVILVDGLEKKLDIKDQGFQKQIDDIKNKIKNSYSQYLDKELPVFDEYYETKVKVDRTKAEADRTKAEVDRTKAEAARTKAETEAKAKPYQDAAGIKNAQETADDAADAYKAAKKTLDSDIDDIIKQLKKDPKKNKDLIADLKNFKKGKFKDDVNKLVESVKTTYPSSTAEALENNIKQVGDLSEKAKEAQEALEAAKELRAKAKSGMVETLNDDIKIKRHSEKGVKVNGKKTGWWNKAEDVADAVANSVDLDGKGTVKLGKLADGVEEVGEKTAKKAGKKAGKKAATKTASKATTATKTLRLGGVFSKLFMGVDCVSAAFDGGMMGYGIAAWAVENNAKNFVKADGSYDTTRASWVKGLGAASGACLGFAAGMWTSGVGAAINAATGGVAGTVVGVVAGGVGALLGLASAALCFKWFG